MHTPPLAGAPPRLPGYDLAPPTEADVLASLTRVFGAERGAQRWDAACAASGLARGGVRTPEQLVRVGAALAADGGAAASVARSIEIRVRTYARLAARAARPGGDA